MHTASRKSGLVSVIVVLGMTLAPASALAQGEVTIGGPFEGEARRSKNCDQPMPC
jgi:hypothetical protein